MKKISNEFQVGLFVISALSLFVGSLFVMGSERKLLTPKVRYETFFTDVQGLHSGAPVRMGGITVGRVDEIVFSMKNPNKSIKVNLEVDLNYQKLIKPNSFTTIATQGLLGDMFLNISTNISEDGAYLKDGSEIKSKETEDIKQLANSAGELFTEVSDTVTKVGEVVDKIDGESLKELNAALMSFHNGIEKLNHGHGILNELSKDGELLNDIKITAKNIAQLTSQLNNNKDVTSILTSLNNITKAFEIAFVGEKESDNENSAIKDLAKALKNLKVVTNALAQGQGSIGALLMDPTLYNNAVAFTDTANKNVILREAVRSTLE